MDRLVLEFERALLSVDRVEVRNILEQCASTDIIECLETVVAPAMESIGKKWEEGEVALSQIYMGGKLSEEIISEMVDNSTITKRKNDPKLAIVLFNDYHGLGKRMVHSVVKASGYEILDYGRMDSSEKIIERLEEDAIHILLISTLMLNSALKISELIKNIKERGLLVKVVVGGAPFRFDTNLYKEIGADAMGKNASDIINIISELKEEL